MYSSVSVHKQQCSYLHDGLKKDGHDGHDGHESLKKDGHDGHIAMLSETLHVIYSVVLIQNIIRLVHSCEF